MTVLVSAPVRIIGFGERKAGIIRELDVLKMESAAVINLHCLNDYRNFSEIFSQFRELMENREYFKILQSEIEDDVKNLPASIDWQGRKDILYVGSKLEFTEDVIRRYWNWKVNFKSVISQSPAF